MCCSVTIGNSRASNATEHKYHAVAGFVCGGKGYLFDSNQRKSFPCQWWNPEKLKKVVHEDLAQFYPFFKNGQIDFLVYNYVIFSRQAYVNDIRLSCRLKYKKTKTPVGGNSAGFNPAQQAAIKHARARRNAAPKLNKSFYNSLLESAKSKENARQTIKNLVSAGYRTDPMLQHQFLLNMNKKFSRPVNSPRTERRKNIENKFNVYWKSLTKNNRNTVRGYIARHKSVSPVSANYFKNINALKTAKARAEWLKAKKLNFKKDELVALKEYVKKKNQVNKNRRAAKKNLKK